jgi:hypothetical protein
MRGLGCDRPARLKAVLSKIVGQFVVDGHIFWRTPKWFTGDNSQQHQRFGFCRKSDAIRFGRKFLGFHDYLGWPRIRVASSGPPLRERRTEKGRGSRCLPAQRIARDERNKMERARRERQELDLETGPVVDARFRAIAKKVVSSSPAHKEKRGAALGKEGSADTSR